MALERCSGRFLLVALSGIMLSACSPSASTAVPPAANTVTTPPSSTSAASGTSAPMVSGLPDFTGLVERYGPAVVNVQVVEGRRNARGAQGAGQEDPFGDFFRRFGIPNLPNQQPRNQPPARGVGSGFIVDDNGVILTNAHVVEGADRVTVKLNDRREFSARVLGSDPLTDIAVLKIDARQLPVVPLGSERDLRVGE